MCTFAACKISHTGLPKNKFEREAKKTGGHEYSAGFSALTKLDLWIEKVKYGISCC